MRDDLLGVTSGESTHNTLREIASDADLESSQLMDTNATTPQMEQACDAPVTSSQLLNNSSQTEPSIYSNISTRRDSAHQGHNSNSYQKGIQRGRGRGRGQDNAFHLARKYNTPDLWSHMRQTRSNVAKAIRIARRDYILSQLGLANGDA